MAFTNVSGRKKRPPMAAGFAVPTPQTGEMPPGMSGTPAGGMKQAAPAVPGVTPAHTKATGAEQLVRAARARLFGEDFDMRNVTPAQLAIIERRNLFANNPRFSQPTPGRLGQVPRGASTGAPVGAGSAPAGPQATPMGSAGMKQAPIKQPFDLPTPGVMQPKPLQRRRRSAGY